jgi:hypothetical protein
MKLTPKQLRQVIKEELTRVLLEDRGLEQLELPGIPADNPEQAAASLAAAKEILPKVLAGDEDPIVHLAYAAPRAVKGLSAPLSGIKDATTRLMMDYNVNINEDIAQQVLNILKRHPRALKIINRIIKTMERHQPGTSVSGAVGGALEGTYLLDTMRHAEFAAEDQSLEQELSYLDEHGTSI